MESNDILMTIMPAFGPGNVRFGGNTSRSCNTRLLLVPILSSMTNTTSTRARWTEVLATPTDLDPAAVREVAAALNALLADMFTLYMKTKNFHWHMFGPCFREYHFMLDEQADQIYATTDIIAERIRKIGAVTLRSIGDISRHQRLVDNDLDYMTPHQMLAELRDDNQQLAAYLREAFGVCDEYGDVAGASVIEAWIDEAEQRIWFLYETSRTDGTSGRQS